MLPEIPPLSPLLESFSRFFDFGFGFGDSGGWAQDVDLEAGVVGLGVAESEEVGEEVDQEDSGKDDEEDDAGNGKDDGAETTDGKADNPNPNPNPNQNPTHDTSTSPPTPPDTNKPLPPLPPSHQNELTFFPRLPSPAYIPARLRPIYVSPPLPPSRIQEFLLSEDFPDFAYGGEGRDRGVALRGPESRYPASSWGGRVVRGE